MGEQREGAMLTGEIRPQMTASYMLPNNPTTKADLLPRMTDCPQARTNGREEGRWKSQREEGRDAYLAQFF